MIVRTVIVHQNIIAGRWEYYPTIIIRIASIIFDGVVTGRFEINSITIVVWGIYVFYRWVIGIDKEDSILFIG